MIWYIAHFRCLKRFSQVNLTIFYIHVHHVIVSSMEKPKLLSFCHKVINVNICLSGIYKMIDCPRTNIVVKSLSCTQLWNQARSRSREILSWLSQLAGDFFQHQMHQKQIDVSLGQEEIQLGLFQHYHHFQ